MFVVGWFPSFLSSWEGYVIKSTWLVMDNCLIISWDLCFSSIIKYPSKINTKQIKWFIYRRFTKNKVLQEIIKKYSSYQINDRSTRFQKKFYFLFFLSYEVATFLKIGYFLLATKHKIYLKYEFKISFFFFSLSSFFL